jgi:rifamycin polyketide synthase module 9/10
VSSFGISGTNAHLILEQAPAAAPAPAAPPVTGGLVPLVVSGKGADAVRAQAARLADWLGADRNSGLDPADVAAALLSTRALLDDRAVVLAAGRDDALAGLAALADGKPAPHVVTGTAAGGEIVFLFPGQGSQRPGMGRELYEAFPAYAEAFDEVCAELDKHLGDVPVRDVVWGAGGDLDQTVHTQAALFAVEVALAKLLRSFGIVPDLVVGHSIGEVSAACVAGVLSIADAAVLVAARGRLMQALPAGGAMVSVRATEADVAGLLTDGVELAAVNGPGAVVLSGDRDALQRAVADLPGVRWLKVSHAFHSARMDPMLADFEAAISGLEWLPPQASLVSTVAGDLVSVRELCSPGYWVRNARETVRFAAAVAVATERGGRTFVEVGPGSALTSLLSDPGAGRPLLRTDRPEVATTLTAVAGLFTAGAPVTWTPVLGGARRAVELPTYAFRHEHFWLTPDPAQWLSAGSDGTGHPLLSGAVALPGLDGLVLTGRLSARTQPWLAEHRVAGVLMLPGTGLVEMALRAGDEAGCPTLDELIIEQPLVLPERGGLRVQVMVGAPDETGHRTVEIFTAPDGDAGDWTRHARGALSTRKVEPGFDFTAWPPADAVPVPVGDLYEVLGDHGYGYGPVFTGLSALWIRGDEVFADVALPEPDHESARSYGLHPALLDAALHTGMLDAGGSARSGTATLNTDMSGGPRVPFVWNGVSLHAAGAAEVRVRLAPAGPDSMSLVVADALGAPVLTLDSLVTRAAAVTSRESDQDALLRLDWAPIEAPSAAESLPAFEVVEVAGDETGPGRAQALTAGVLRRLQSWLAQADPEAVLVVVTRGGTGEVSDPAMSAVWGLVRAAQAENPGRFVIVDADLGAEVDVPAVLACGEPQVSVRGGVWSVPRLVREPVPVSSEAVLDPDGIVLITGGTGSLGGLVARHLVSTHGARHVVLVSRRGADAPGAAELVGELAGLGAQARVVACDVADREAVRGLVDGFDRRLSLVVHAAGVSGAGVVTSLDADGLDAVFGAKVLGAQHLDELTGDRDGLILFSSAAGLFIGAGSADYAAANAFLDGLAAQSRAQGRKTTSLAWGLWEQDGGMDERLSDAGRSRLRRDGVVVMPRAEALRLFDAGLRSTRAVLVPVKLDLHSLRGGAPVLLKGLVRTGRRAAGAARAADPAALSGILADQSPDQRRDTLVALVRTQIAVVLGHAGADDVDPEQGLFDIGFDSLTAVDLRNRLGAATGTALPPTVVFDFPTASMLADYLAEDFAERLGDQPAAATEGSVHV